MEKLNVVNKVSLLERVYLTNYKYVYIIILLNSAD